MRKTKLWARVVAVIMILSLAGCGGAPASSSGNTPAASVAPSSGAQPADSTPTQTPASSPDGIIDLPADGPVYNLTFADGWAIGSFPQVVSLVLREYVETYGKGKINISFHHNSELGSNREIFEAVQFGNIDIAYLVTSQQATFVPALSVFDLANALGDFDAAVKVLSGGKFRDRLQEEYRTVNVELISMFPTGYRELSTNKEIRKFEDFKGLKLRTMETPFHMEYWRNLGANPTPLAIAEVYIALQQGLVEGQENPLDVIEANRFYEVQKYIVLTNHLLFVNTTTINKDLWESMPTEYQQFLMEGMRRMEEFAAINCQKSFDESRAKLVSEGMEIIELPDAEIEKIKEAIQPLYQKIRETAGDDLVDSLLEEMAANASK